MSDFRPLRRLTRCPECMQTVEANLAVADNGCWRLRQHARSQVSSEPCPSSEGRWRLKTQYLKGSGEWADAWERPR